MNESQFDSSQVFLFEGKAFEFGSGMTATNCHLP